MYRYFRFVLPLIMLSMLAMMGCGKGPSGGQIETLVKQDLDKHVPPKMANLILPGSKAVVNEINVKQNGEVQKINSTDYYPVMVYCRGTCKAILGNEVPFEGTQEYYFWKDPYGNWKVAHNKDDIGR